MHRRSTRAWQVLVFLTLFGVTGTGCAPAAALLYKLALYAGQFLLATVAAKTLERALDELFVPSKSAAQKESKGTTPAIEVDRYDPLRGTYRGKLTLVEEKTGKLCVLENPRMYRETEDSPWRIHKDYLNEIRDTLKK